MHSLIEHSKKIYICSLNIIRKELKEAPKEKIAGVNIRASLLRIYDTFVQKEYIVDAKINKIAESYYIAYRALGGSITKSRIFNDFLIIACATKYQIDIVVSEDNRTMFGELASRAYLAVNKAEQLKQPNFIGYEDFKNALKK